MIHSCFVLKWNHFHLENVNVWQASRIQGWYLATCWWCLRVGSWACQDLQIHWDYRAVWGLCLKSLALEHWFEKTLAGLSYFHFWPVPWSNKENRLAGFWEVREKYRAVFFRGSWAELLDWNLKMVQNSVVQKEVMIEITSNTVSQNYLVKSQFVPSIVQHMSTYPPGN